MSQYYKFEKETKERIDSCLLPSVAMYRRVPHFSKREFGLFSSTEMANPKSNSFKTPVSLNPTFA